MGDLNYHVGFLLAVTLQITQQLTEAEDDTGTAQEPNKELLEGASGPWVLFLKHLHQRWRIPSP